MVGTLHARTSATAGSVAESAQSPKAKLESGQNLPKHIAVIMDGNGRWAVRHGLPRTEGHRKGVEALRGCIRRASEIGVEILTVYAFSSENWSRPKSEIDDLMGLLKSFIRRDLKKLNENGVRVRMIGNRENLKADILRQIEEAESLTKDNDRFTLVVAFNYGSRDELRRAIRDIGRDVAAGRVDPEDIDDQLVSGKLDTAGIPEPDLLIRTSGEIRLSNFLLWQCAYTEFVFTDVYWPDFDASELDAAINEYNRRDRRYGGILEKVSGS